MARHHGRGASGRRDQRNRPDPRRPEIARCCWRCAGAAPGCRDRNRGPPPAACSAAPGPRRPTPAPADADPYSRATIARSGELPIGTGDGVAFSATTDDRKRPLDGRCDVVVSGVTPAARFWTLTLYDSKGHLVANSLQRYGFTSQEIIRGADGAFEIRVASRSRAGNWLPTGGIERYALMLRLYDTPVGVATRSQRDAPMPSVATVGGP